jgi:hypothetical protein
MTSEAFVDFVKRVTCYSFGRLCEMSQDYGSLALFLLLACSLCSCSSSPVEPEDFVLIYIGSSMRTSDNKLVDPVDKNAFFIEGAMVYHEFIKRGVSPQNIYFLYKDGRPDLDEPLVDSVKDSLEEEFLDDHYDHEATIVNLLKIERQIQRKLTAGSNFFLIVDGHGVVDRFGFKIRSEHDKSYLRSSDISDMLRGNRGRNHLFIGSCYSGQFFKDVDDIDARVVTAAPFHKAVWLDRDVSFAREYFLRIPRNLSSSEFLYNSAFEKAVLKFQRWGFHKAAFIQNEYEGDGLADFEVLDWAPVTKKLGKFK